jgi:hypothetical protein
MNNLDWLLSGDESIVRLTKKYLLDEDIEFNEKGITGKYLSLYDETSKTWGQGFYGPKWVSTNYTLLELKYMEINPNHLYYQEGLKNYLDHYFHKQIEHKGIESMDLCITGMFIQLLSYGRIQDQRLNVLLDYALDHLMNDGAWNCLHNHASNPQISSVHTTINVLEGLQEYLNNEYGYRRNDVMIAVENAISTLLNRQLIFIKGTTTPIHESFLHHHYTPRWKYDYLRVLEFLARVKYPLVDEMKPALDLMIQNMTNGRLTKGTTYSGLIHFPLEKERFGRFNTFRSYLVLKAYNPSLFEEMMNKNID